MPLAKKKDDKNIKVEVFLQKGFYLKSYKMMTKLVQIDIDYKIYIRTIMINCE